MANCIKQIWKDRSLPEEWTNIYWFLYKKGLKDKVLEEQKVLDRMQFGFRKEKGTIEENTRKKGKDVCFVDLKGAFDKLKRKAIWKKLREKKV